MAQILGIAGRFRLLATLSESEREKFTVSESGFMYGTQPVGDETIMSLYSEGELLRALRTPVFNEAEVLDRPFPDPADVPAREMGDTRRA